MEPCLGRTRKLQLHEMHLFVVRPIMDPPQLVDLIEPVIHIRVPTLRIKNSISLTPTRRTAPRHRSHIASHDTLQKALARTSRFHPTTPVRSKNTCHPQGLPYLLLNPLIMKASCFSITLSMACTILGPRKQGPLTQDRVKRDVGAHQAHLHVRFSFHTAALECS